MPPTLTESSNGNGVEFSGRLEMGESRIDRIWRAGGGFENLGDYVRCASKIQGHGELDTDSTLRYADWQHASRTYTSWLARRDATGVSRAISSPDGMYETSEPDGGSLVPPGLIREVWDRARFTDTPFKRAKIVFVRSNAGVLPTIPETSRVDGSRWGGVLGYWQGEAQQFNKLHGTLGNDRYQCKKLTLLIPASDELFEDSGLLDEYVTTTAGKELSFQLCRAMIAGTGAGMPLGVAGANCSIFVAKDTGQQAKTISTSNVQNMWIQTHGPSRATGQWWANEEFDPDSLGLPVSPMTGWNAPVATPTLKGRPVAPLEFCPAIGSPCDLFFGDFSQYLLVIRGLEKTISMHFKFDYMNGYFRFSYRVDGAPLWTTPLTSLYGTVPKSPFVGIAQRS